MNDSTIRIEKIVINGIKNVMHGEIILNEYNALLKCDFEYKDSLLGLYGQNGSGKTTVIEATSILRDILKGKPLDNNIEKYINNETQRASLEYTLYSQDDNNKILFTYLFEIALDADIYGITYEKMICKIFDKKIQKWNSQKTLFEVKQNEITLMKLRKKLNERVLIELGVRKSDHKGTSLFFNKKNREKLLKELSGKNETILRNSLISLQTFAYTNLIIIENDKMGSVGASKYLPINIYLEEKDSVFIGVNSVNLLEKSELDTSLWKAFKKFIDQIDAVLNSLIPSLQLKIVNTQDITLEDGKEGKSFEIVSIRNEKGIPLKYESEGIKRIISVTSALIAAYNYPFICVMIDEFDSGIFEYLLGEILEIFEESGKGQLVFTSHNLRPLEKISYKSIIFTTTNPNNRYIRLKNIKPNNNIRDVYYNSIMLGGQEEQLYVETKNHIIKRAFRKAGKMNG